ncbi:MAG TPA: GNAT family N-acetyltransferase [Acidimicrobiales bacterium]|nr:GNAT family N-acetyltransferase [Acidimicrobiales bacterium]
MSDGRLPIEFREADPLAAPAADLIRDMVGEIAALYGITGRVGVPFEPAELVRPDGVYLVGWVDTQAVAGGGVRRIGPGVGEIKRMYIRPDSRGRGLSAFLLAALEEAAVDLGLGTVRLDTGPSQPAAVHLYESRGYRSIGNYNANPHASFWGEKQLI